MNERSMRGGRDGEKRQRQRERRRAPSTVTPPKKTERSRLEEKGKEGKNFKMLTVFRLPKIDVGVEALSLAESS